jgi:hypothetical protein
MKWFKITEDFSDLPELDVDVIWYAADCDWMIIGELNEEYEVFAVRSNYKLKQFTHWMPLPEAPEKE